MTNAPEAKTDDQLRAARQIALNAINEELPRILAKQGHGELVLTFTVYDGRLRYVDASPRRRHPVQ